MVAAQIVVQSWREFMSSRELAVSGTFYPKDDKDIRRYIEHFNSIIKEHNLNFKVNSPRAIIVPHAGYIYSGFSANLAYKIVSKSQDIQRVVVIGPSHRVYLDGVSVGLYDEYPTPLGSLKIDREFSQRLIDTYPFAKFYDKAHKEHSTETQIPFIKEYISNSQIVEIIYGKVDFNLLSIMVQDILDDKNSLVVISTDLSHFYNLKKAKELDNICINAILKRDINLFDRGCEACGLTGVKALIKVAKKINLDIKLLDYRTSYDVTKDDQSVVGYTSFILF
jgi:AmmeMemoRadiSam system protein B